MVSPGTSLILREDEDGLILREDEDGIGGKIGQLHFWQSFLAT